MVTPSAKRLVGWIVRDDVRNYIIEAYAGTEERRRKCVRRVFLWEEDGTVMMGNVEAFALHLLAHFGISAHLATATSNIHRLLVELGECAGPHLEDRSPPNFENGPYVGIWKQPEPESWEVKGQVPPKGNLKTIVTENCGGPLEA